MNEEFMLMQIKEIENMEAFVEICRILKTIEGFQHCKKLKEINNIAYSRVNPWAQDQFEPKPKESKSE